MGGDLKLEMPMGFATRFRPMCAYVADALTSRSDGAKTPALLEFAAKVNFRYVPTQEEIDGSGVFAGKQSFTSMDEIGLRSSRAK